MTGQQPRRRHPLPSVAADPRVERLLDVWFGQPGWRQWCDPHLVALYRGKMEAVLREMGADA